MAPRSNKKAVVLCLFQSLAGLLFGWEQSSGSGLFNMQTYASRFGVCDAVGVCALPTIRQSTITGILSVGAFLGALGSGSVADKIGLRVTCLTFIFVFMVGIAIETSAEYEYAQICVGRLLTGFGIGATSGLVPVFQAEAAPPALRGLITGSFQLCVTLGIFLVNCVNYGMSTHTGAVSWRLPISLQLIWAGLLFVGFLFSPESPRFLARKNKWEACRKNLANLRGLPVDDPEIDIEMDEIRVHKEEDDVKGDARYIEILSMKDRILWRTMIGILVQIGQQTTGINFFFSYGIQFAQAAGIDNVYVFQIILSAVNFVMSFPGLVFVDRFGRRPVLLWGAAVMIAGQCITGAVAVTHPDEPTAGKVLIAFSCIFVAGFASSWGPVAWVVCGESFPVRLASKCVTLATSANWGMNLVIAFASPIVQDKIGTNITFVWTGFLIFSFLFAFFCIPETKGMSIEEVDALYLSNTPAWRSTKFRKDQEEAEIKGQEKHYAKSHHEETKAQGEPKSTRTSADTSESV